MVQENDLRVALILGSTREGRFCERIANWARSRVEASGMFSIDWVDPQLLHLPFQHKQQPVPEVVSLRERIDAADAFIIVTPEYNHGYPAAVKFLIDHAQTQWFAKPVAFVSYGGVSGGLRAVEQLRQVFAELHAVTLRDSVSFSNPWDRFDESGTLEDPEGPERRMAAVMEYLQWWALALKTARRARSYQHLGRKEKA